MVCKSPKILILCDFDGTICTVDMGNEILNRFTDKGWEEIDRAYCANEIGSLDAYRRIAPLFRGTKPQMLEFIESYEKIDPYFLGFYEFCGRQGVDLKIVSDGLDFYIETILGKYDLRDIEYFSNVAVFGGDCAFSIEFPRMNEKCERCGTCKSGILEKYRSEYGKVFYVGDGHSDVCPAGKADLVFAKGVLYEKCKKNGTPCISYDNFGDIQAYLSVSLI